MGGLQIEKTPPKSITDERNMTPQGKDAKWSNPCKITSGKCTSGITVISKSITNEWVMPQYKLIPPNSDMVMSQCNSKVNSQ